MSFGSSKPIAVRVIGTDYDEVRKHAEKIAGELKKIPLPPRCRLRADARLSHGRGRDRPRAGGVDRHHPRARQACAGHGDLLDPLHQPQLLDQREDRLRLSGADPGAAAADGEAGGSRGAAAGVGQPRRSPDDPRRAEGRPGSHERAARRVRPRHVAALPDRGRQRRGRGHGPGREAGPQGGQGRRRPAPRRARRGDGPAPVDDPDVRGAGDRAGGRGVRHPRALDGVFPIAAAGA